MHRLPASKEFGAELRGISSTTNCGEQRQEFEALARLELDYLQTIQFYQSVKMTNCFQEENFPNARLAILSSTTVDHLQPALTVSGIRHGVFLELHASPFDQYRQELLLPESSLAQFQPDFVLFSLSARDILAGIPISTTAMEVEKRVEDHLSELPMLWRAARKMSNAVIVQQTYLNIGETLFGSFDRMLPSAPTQVIRQLNQRMIEVASENGITILDLDRAVERDGLQFWFDHAKWLNAKIEISPIAATKYADLVARIVAAHRGLSRKCLVLDLDNTLWGGVIGDDGLNNLALGPGSGLGEAHMAFQRYVKMLKNRGIILAVCSKNDLANAKSVFLEHPDMILGLEDITAFIANWDDKATNLLRIAEELNIGLDSLVFVDDNPAERALIRQSLPMVAVPELPRDPSDFVQCLSGAGYFEAASFTSDDLKRNAQYAQNRQRKLSQTSSQSIDDYLESLKMRMKSSSFTDVDLPRIAQLINKTNQFNTTTQRKTIDDVRTIAAAQDNITLQVRLSDRFGENGLISVVVMIPSTHSESTYEIETWVMSCRVFGRQLEYEILNSIVKRSREAEARYLIASYIPTEKNSLIKDLYANLGFESMPGYAQDTSDQERWILDLHNFTNHMTHIT